MVEAPPSSRSNVIALVLVAILSALVVSSIYEVRARLAKHRSAAQAAVNSPGEDQPADPIEASPTGIEDNCASLRRRYLARCPSELPARPPARQAESPAPRPSDDEARAADQLAVWLHPAPAELADMAKRCEVRFEMPAITENQPPTVSDEASTALSLTRRERAFLDQTLSEMHAGLRDFASQAAAESVVAAGKAPPSLEDIVNDLQARPDSGFEKARERLAQERAGLVVAPQAGAQQPAGERLVRLWARLGDDFERRLADGLGRDRARQLRASPQASWMNRFSQSGCRSSAP